MTTTAAIAQMMSRKDFAAILSVTTRTLENWEAQGKGPMPIRLGRAVRYDSNEVAEFVRVLRQGDRSAKAKAAAADQAPSPASPTA
jgi:predicted DNA-binding transcriptional regulator AlpA